MKKRIIIKCFALFSLLLINGCTNNNEQNISTTSQSSLSSINVNSTSNSDISSNADSSIILTSSLENYSYSSNIEQSQFSNGNHSSIESEISNSSITNNSSSNSILSSENEIEKNPDGSKKLSAPQNINSPIDITEWNNFDFTNELPENFSYIYGNNKVKADIYGDGSGLVMDKNTSARKGLQTPCFNSWLKLEIRLDLGKFHANTKTRNLDDPVFTIYGFNNQSKIVETYFIEEINVQDNSPIKFYLRNENISYIEIRATNLPFKSGKVYNFGIKGMSIKGWPYSN